MVDWEWVPRKGLFFEFWHPSCKNPNEAPGRDTAERSTDRPEV